MSGAGHLVRDINIALYGDAGNKRALARDLAVSADSVQDWLQGRMNPRPGVWSDAEAVLLERRRKIDEVLERVQAITGGATP